MRIVIDAKKIENSWFDISEFEDCALAIINRIKSVYTNAELFIVLGSSDDTEACINVLVKHIKRNNIKTICFYPPYNKDLKQDQHIFEIFRKWYFSQFNADLIFVADYEFNLVQDLEKLDNYTIKTPISIDECLTELQNSIRTRSDSYYAKLAYSFEDSKLFLNNNIFIDISGNIIHEDLSGIQRVVNGFATGMETALKQSKSEVKCYPVYLSSNNGGYYYAEVNKNRFSKQVCEDGNSVVQFHDGDIIFMPDLNINLNEKENYYMSLKKRGVKIISYLHDIFPIHYPEQYAETDISERYTNFLETISKLSGVITNSKTTLKNYVCWCKDYSIEFSNDFILDYAYLGADLNKAMASKGLPKNYKEVLAMMKSTVSLIMVGTICPRKNHELVLDAMSLLWAKGVDVNLIFVGNYGWEMSSFVRILESHKMFGNKLFWIKKASDEYLDLLYKESDGVIYISVDEGYGLPIIEASYYNKPLLLRDIDIFHEIAGENATYYKGSRDPFLLAGTMEKWIGDIKSNEVIESKGIKYYTWEESSRKLLNILLDKRSGVINDF